MAGSTEDRLSLIETRLETLEAALNQIILDMDDRSAAPVAPVVTSSAAPIASSQIPLPPQSGWSGQYQMVGSPSSSAAAPAPSKPRTEVNWLGIVGTICFILAAGFIVKLAVESGWLTPPRQIGLACLFGLTLIGVGFWMRRFDKAYASLLPGAGIVVLYMSFLAAHAVHMLIPATTALGLVAVTSAACVALYTQLRLDVYLLTAIIGSYLSPILLGKEVQIDFSIAYFVCCSIAFASIAIWLERRIAAITAAYLAIFMTTILGLKLTADMLVIWALAFHFVIFAGGTALHSLKTGRALNRNEAWSFFPVLMLFYACEYFFIDKVAPTYAPWISLAFAGVLIGIYFASRRAVHNGVAHSKEVVAAYATVVLFHSVYLELLTDTIRPWLLIAVVGAAIFAPRRAGESIPDAWKFPLFGLLAVAVIEYVRIASSLVIEPDQFLMFPGFAATAAFMAFYVMRARELPGGASSGFAVLGAAHGLAILSLYRLFEPMGSLAVSAGWLGYAVVTIGVGFQRRDAVLAKSALGVLALAAAKALLYDAASAPTVVRIVCLLLTGVVLFGCGLLLKKIAAWGEARA